MMVSSGGGLSWVRSAHATQIVSPEAREVTVNLSIGTFTSIEKTLTLLIKTVAAM